MITEDYVSFEIAKLLKEKGFDEMCNSSYGPSYQHKGKNIDEDEEFELKCEGREHEIEVVDGGSIYNFWNKNNDNQQSVYSRPSLYVTMKWLGEVHNLGISISVTVDGWRSGVSRIKLDSEGYVVDIIDGIDGGNIPNCDTYKEACEAAIKYCLENLI